MYCNIIILIYVYFLILLSISLLLFTDALETHMIYQGPRTIDGLVNYLEEHNQQVGVFESLFC